VLTNAELEELLRIRNSKTESHSKVSSASMLYDYYRGLSITERAKSHQTNRPKVERCINRAWAYGVIEALNDMPRPSRSSIITDDAKAWVVSIACNPPPRTTDMRRKPGLTAHC